MDSSNDDPRDESSRRWIEASNIQGTLSYASPFPVNSYVQLNQTQTQTAGINANMGHGPMFSNSMLPNQAPLFTSQPVGFLPPETRFPRRIVETPSSSNNVLTSCSTTNKRRKRFHGCSCKKSECLQLYCECYASGEYCLDSCKCIDCLNRPEYGDTVEDSREKLKSRNPSAFAPKIVEANSFSRNVTGYRSSTTPASARAARHRSGCNCMKSSCVKGYCECFKAGVGCCHECRCVDCKNTSGRKPEPGEWRVNPNAQAAQPRLTALGPHAQPMANPLIGQAGYVPFHNMPNLIQDVYMGSNPGQPPAGSVTFHNIPNLQQVYMGSNTLQPQQPNPLFEVEDSWEDILRKLNAPDAGC